MIPELIVAVTITLIIIWFDKRRQKPSFMEKLAMYDAEMACQKIHYQHMEDTREEEEDA